MPPLSHLIIYRKGIQIPPFCACCPETEEIIDLRKAGKSEKIQRDFYAYDHIWMARNARVFDSIGQILLVGLIKAELQASEFILKLQRGGFLDNLRNLRLFVQELLHPLKCRPHPRFPSNELSW